jgi:enoyl-CoA hydratase
VERVSGKSVYWRREGRVATITIDNPPLNVLSSAVCRELKQAVEQADDDSAVSVVVITGAGERAFVAGGDIREFPRLLKAGSEAVREHARLLHSALNLIDSLRKPVVAAINGVALGGGCELAMACDLRIAEEQVMIGVPEIKLGIFPGGGGTQRLPRLVGEGRAKELLFTGESITAREAERIGLVNSVVPRGEALAAATKLASRIAGMSLPALTRAKWCVNEGADLPLAEALEVELGYFGEVFQTEEAAEGVSAYMEKRPPRFAQR